MNMVPKQVRNKIYQMVWKKTRFMTQCTAIDGNLTRIGTFRDRDQISSIFRYLRSGGVLPLNPVDARVPPTLGHSGRMGSWRGSNG